MTFETFISSDFTRILFAAIAGASIGAEREYRNKNAGFRTITLICVGACLFTILSINMAGAFDPTRIASNIITGVGFLGAGAIFREENKVSGLTTASTIWVAAALGMGIGAGEFQFIILVSLLVIIVLVGLVPIQHFIDKKHIARRYRIVCKFRDEPLLIYDEMFKQSGMRFSREKQKICGDQITGQWTATGNPELHDRLAKLLIADKNIIELEF